jgi:hypothetical protein
MNRNNIYGCAVYFSKQPDFSFIPKRNITPPAVIATLNSGIDFEHELSNVGQTLTTL